MMSCTISGESADDGYAAGRWKPPPPGAGDQRRQSLGGGGFIGATAEPFVERGEGHGSIYDLHDCFRASQRAILLIGTAQARERRKRWWMAVPTYRNHGALASLRRLPRLAEEDNRHHEAIWWSPRHDERLSNVSGREDLLKISFDTVCKTRSGQLLSSSFNQIPSAGLFARSRREAPFA